MESVASMSFHCFAQEFHDLFRISSGQLSFKALNSQHGTFFRLALAKRPFGVDTASIGTCGWAGRDNDCEQEKAEARKRLEKRAESHLSVATHC